jgi:hypothetical protein
MRDFHHALSLHSAQPHGRDPGSRAGTVMVPRQLPGSAGAASGESGACGAWLQPGTRAPNSGAGLKPGTIEWRSNRANGIEQAAAPHPRPERSVPDCIGRAGRPLPYPPKWRGRGKKGGPSVNATSKNIQAEKSFRNLSTVVNPEVLYPSTTAHEGTPTGGDR